MHRQIYIPYFILYKSERLQRTRLQHLQQKITYGKYDIVECFTHCSRICKRKINTEFNSVSPVNATADLIIFYVVVVEPSAINRKILGTK